MRMDVDRFYQGMNQSVRNRNAALEDQGGKRWEYEQRQMSGALEDNALMRELMRAKIARMQQPTPDFYGSDSLAYSAPQISSGEPSQPPEWFMRPRRGSGMGGGNFLAKLLGGAK